MLNHIGRKQAIFGLINGLVGDVSILFESGPNQDGTSDMITLDAGFATLASFNPSDLFGFALKLLNLPANEAHLLNLIG